MGISSRTLAVSVRWIRCALTDWAAGLWRSLGLSAYMVATSWSMVLGPSARQARIWLVRSWRCWSRAAAKVWGETEGATEVVLFDCVVGELLESEGVLEREGGVAERKEAFRLMGGP